MYLYEKLVPPITGGQPAASNPAKSSPSTPSAAEQSKSSAAALAALVSYNKVESNIAKTLHFVLDALFAGFPEVYRSIRDQLREQEEHLYGRRPPVQQHLQPQF
jgi:hypothetical protein